MRGHPARSFSPALRGETESKDLYLFRGRRRSEPSERHHVAHFHAYYGEHVAVFSISPVALIIGFIPQRQQRLRFTASPPANSSLRIRCGCASTMAWRAPLILSGFLRAGFTGRCATRRLSLRSR